MIKIPKLNKWDIVRIEWSDPSSLSGVWQKIEDDDMKIAGVITVGQVYKVHDDRITLVLTWDSTNDHANGGITIPYFSIDKIEVFT